MHEAAAVGVVETTRRLEADRERLRRREPVALVEKRAQAAAAEVLEDEIGPVVVLAPVEDRHDVGMAQGGGRLGLGPEAAQEGFVVGQGGVQHLDRDASPQRHVLGQEDVSGRTRADGSEQAVPAAEHAAELVRHA